MKLEEFIKYTSDLGINLSDNQLNQFAEYINYLIEYNKHTNLTNIVESEMIYLKHFYDSLMIKEVVDLNEITTVIDVGTGAGFPGLVLKIAFPHLKLTLLDSNNKKTKFLNELCQRLGVYDVSIINERSEVYAKEHLDSYELVVSRAVASLPILSELCLPLVKVGGNFISLKGDASEELEKAKKIITTLKGEIEEVFETSLPIEDAKRTFIKIRKLEKTPAGYPRSYNKIASVNK